MSRGAVTKKTSQLVGLWMPHVLDAAIERAVHIEDTDRSKFIRRAVREKLDRMGIPVPKTEQEAA